MVKLANLQSGNLGEILALAKITTLGVAVYTSPDGAPGHDLIAIVNKTHRSIEVKTRQYEARQTEITRWPLNMRTKGDADFFLFVEVDLRSLTPTFYLLNNKQARDIYREDKSGGNCPPSKVRRIVEANDFSPLQQN